MRQFAERKPIGARVVQLQPEVTLTVNATDSDGTITKVDFYRGTTLLGTSTSAQGGATAQQQCNSNGVRSSYVAFALIFPAQHCADRHLARLSDQKSRDAATVLEIVARVKTELIASNTPPYNVTWNNVDYGNYNLTAIATDNQGITNAEHGTTRNRTTEQRGQV